MTGTIAFFHCPRCRRSFESRRPMVPSDFYDVLKDYVREAAGDEFVLLPVATLNAIGQRAEVAEERVRDLEARIQDLGECAVPIDAGEPSAG